LTLRVRQLCEACAAQAAPCRLVRQEDRRYGTLARGSGATDSCSRCRLSPSSRPTAAQALAPIATPVAGQSSGVYDVKKASETQLMQVWKAASQLENMIHSIGRRSHNVAEQHTATWSGRDSVKMLVLKDHTLPKTSSIR
jgi:hypothetical protein